MTSLLFIKVAAVEKIIWKKKMCLKSKVKLIKKCPKNHYHYLFAHHGSLFFKKKKRPRL